MITHFLQIFYLGHSQGVSLRREYTRRIHALGLTTRRVLQAVVWMSVLPSMIMQSTRNMIETWPMLADVTVGWTASRLLQEVEVTQHQRGRKASAAYSLRMSSSASRVRRSWITG